MTRRGRRREVLDALDAPLRRLKWLKEQWTVAGTVYVDPAERAPGASVVRRPRRPEEYPENDANAWAALRAQAYAAALELERLRAYADLRYEDLVRRAALR